MMDVARRESGTRIRKRDVVFLTAKLGSSRETTKSENHSSSNILAVYKRLKTEICRNLTNSHNPKKNTGAFSPESRESIKTNELQRDSAQRFTMALRAVFSPPALYSLHPHPMGQSANLSPSRTPISSQRPTPRDHRSIEAQKNSRKNKTTAHFRAFLPR